MLSATPALPRWNRVLNTIGKTLQGLNIPVGRLDEETLSQIAIKATGLTDFGPPSYQEGLRHLLDAALHDADLNILGQIAMQRLISMNLINRLMLTEVQKKQPARFQKPLLPPIIIFGFPRSGTTFLHRMLAADPNHRSLPFWELMRPVPPGLINKNAVDRRRKRALSDDRTRHYLFPDMDPIHFIRADSPEECMWMLAATFQSLTYWVSAPVYGYMEWYLTQSLDRKYREYRQFLLLLQSMTPEQRLTLKAPSHAYGLSALIDHVPEALLIQTHRDPVTVCNSLNSLFYRAHSAVTNHIEVRRMADTNVRLLEAGIEHATLVRKMHPNRVVDIQYRELVANPVETVRGLYEHFGLTWTEAYEAELRSYLARNKQGKHGRHTYRASDFGFTESALAERFSGYRARYDF